jgi:hypothetical protein
VSGYYLRDGSMSLRAHRKLFDGYAGLKREVTTEIRDAAAPERR